MGTLMEKLSHKNAQIFLPLLFQMDERPLAAAELEVLQTGELKEIILIKVHQSLPVPIQAALLQ